MWSKDWFDVAVVVSWVLVWAVMVYAIPSGAM